MCVCMPVSVCSVCWVSYVFCVLGGQSQGGGGFMTGMEVFPHVNLGYGCTRDWASTLRLRTSFPVLVFSPGIFMKGLSAPEATLFCPTPRAFGTPAHI